MLANRLCKDILSLGLYDVFMNSALSHPQFMNVFIEILSEKPYMEFKELFLSEQVNFDHVVKTGISLKNNDSITEWVEWFRQKLLLDVTTDYDSLLEDMFMCKDEDEYTITYCVRVLCWVVYYGHTRLLQYIVERVLSSNESISAIFGTEMEEQTRYLILAVYSGNVELCEVILKYIQSESINRTTLSDQSIWSNDHKCVTPSIAACETGNFKIGELLIKHDTSVNMQDEFSRTPLYVVSLVAVNDHFDVVQYLVEIGANENMNSESLGSSPLTTESEEGFYDIVQLLVQNGADIHVCHTCNMTPLYLASKHGHSKIVEYLSENGADVNMCDQVNKSQLYVASENGRVEVVNILLKHEADYLLNSKYGTSPLQIAVLCNRTDVAHQLIRIENQHMKYKGNLYLFQILSDLRQFEMFTNECSIACDVSVQQRKQELLSDAIWNHILGGN